MAQKIKKNAKKFFEQRKPNDRTFKSKVIASSLNALLIAVLLLTIWSNNIYGKTFIPFAIPFTLWILSGLVTTFFLRNFLTAYLLTSSWFLQIVYNIITFGGIVVFVFLCTNYKFADGDSLNTNQTIISTGHLARGKYGSCQKPFAIISYKGHEKQLIFYCDTQVELYKSVDLTVAKGLFGFDIILQSQLKTN